jgi:hypothetical protein
VTPEGSVVVYEGAASRVDQIRQVIESEGVADRVQVRHAVVGEPRSLRGDRGDARAVAPDQLPDCDVLELDCEGTELEILPALDSRPWVMLVETHGMHDAPTEAVASELRTMGTGSAPRPWPTRTDAKPVTGTMSACSPRWNGRRHSRPRIASPRSFIALKLPEKKSL